MRFWFSAPNTLLFVLRRDLMFLAEHAVLGFVLELEYFGWNLAAGPAGLWLHLVALCCRMKRSTPVVLDTH